MRWLCRAQSSYLRRGVHAQLSQSVSSGSTQKLQTLAGSPISTRSAEERWLCTAAFMSHHGEDIFISDDNIEGTKVGSFTSADKEAQYAVLAYGAKEPSRPMETESGSDDPLVEAQSRTICSILNAGIWDSDMQMRLQPLLHVPSTNLVARVLNQVMSVETAKAFFHWVAERDGYRHNTYVYNALIMKLGLAEAFEAIWGLLNRMKAEECSPTSTTFSLIIQAYGKAGRVQGCWTTMDKAVYYGVKPDVRMHTALLQVLFNVQRAVKAKQLICRMEEQKLEFDMHTWFAIIHGLCKNKMVADAQKFLEKMLLSGCKPNAYVFNVMILGFCEAGDHKKGLSYFHLMQKHGCKPDTYTYNTLIQLFCGLNLFAEAEGLVSHMKIAGCEPNHVTFNILLQSFVRNGDAQEADDLFSKMERAGWIDRCSYRIYSSFLMKSRDISKLMSLSERLYSRYGRVDSEVCNAILECYCKAGDLNKAINYLDETFYRLSAPNAFSFALLMNAFCKGGDIDAAILLLSKIAERGCKATSMHYDLIMNALCKHSRGSEAMRLFKEMNMKGVQPSSKACENLLEALSNAGSVEDVILLCKHIGVRRHTVRASTVLPFMKCLNKSGRFEEAKVLLTEMRRAGCFPQSRTFKCCALYLLQGQVTEVEKFFCNQTPNVIQHALMLQKACDNNKLDEAKANLSKMKELGFEPSSGCYSKLIYRLSKTEDTAMDSLELLEEMLERGLPVVEAVPSYLMDSFGTGKQLEVITRFCRTVIANRLTLQKGSASSLLRQENEHELKKLYLELEKSGCLVDSVPTYNA